MKNGIKKYYEAVRYCCEGEDRIPFYNTIEQRLLVYEVLGYPFKQNAHYTAGESARINFINEENIATDCGAQLTGYARLHYNMCHTSSFGE